MLSPQTQAARPAQVYPAETMLRRAGGQDGQILPGLIMLMLAILAIGALSLPDRQGRRAPLERADRLRRRGARRRPLDPRPADRAGRHHRDVGPDADQRAGRARRRRRLRAAQPRAARRLQDGRRRGPHVGRHERQGRLAQRRPRGQGEGARRGSSWRRSSRSASTSTAAARPPAPGSTHITDEQWKDLAKDLHKPLDCPDMKVLADFFKKHGAIPPYENTYMGGAPMPPGGERKTTSLPLRVRRLRRDRPQLPGGDRGVGDQRGPPAPDQARLPHAVAGREPLRPHAHRLPGQRVADRLRAAGSARRAR